MMFANLCDRACQQLESVGIDKQFQWGKGYMLVQTMASENPFFPRFSCFLKTQGTSNENLILDLFCKSDVI